MTRRTLDSDSEADVAALAAALHAERWPDDGQDAHRQNHWTCCRERAVRILAALPANPAPLIDRERRLVEALSLILAADRVAQRKRALAWRVALDNAREVLDDIGAQYEAEAKP